jgi:ABC-type branched-subunit amino acid transport system substrate-binding protein
MVNVNFTFRGDEASIPNGVSIPVQSTYLKEPFPMMRMMRTSSRFLAAAIAVVAVTQAAAACGASGSSSSAAAKNAGATNCSGQPVKLMTIDSLTSPVQHEPEVSESAQAAAAAITKTCELGRPVQIIVCDDRYDPNTAAACGREAVADKVLAVVGSTSAYVENFMPIIAAAGIPLVGSQGNSAIENSSPLAFPLQNGVALVDAEAKVAASLGKKVVIVGLDISLVQTILAIAKNAIVASGVQYLPPVLIPPTATDLSQYAAQATAEGANVIVPVLTAPLVSQLLTALQQQGTSLSATHLVVSGQVMSPSLVGKLGTAASGAYVVGVASPGSDTANSGIRQYQSELSAIGKSNINMSDDAVVAWSTVHIIANLMKGAPSFDPATLVQRLKSAGLISMPQLAPLNFSQNAAPTDPVLSKLRIFSTDVIVSKVGNGVVTPVSDGFIDFENPIKLNANG